jgi:hypothetical protein
MRPFYDERRVNYALCLRDRRPLGSLAERPFGWTAGVLPPVSKISPMQVFRKRYVNE